VASQPGAGQVAGPLVQIRHVEQIGQDEVAIEAHERAGIHRQGQHPAGGGEKEQGAAQGAVRHQAPGQGGQACQGQLCQHAGTGDGQALAWIGELPAFAGVGVEHGPQHDHRHTHVGHPHAVAGGGEGVAELVQSLGAGQGQGKADQATGAQIVHEAGAEAVPLTPCEEQAGQTEQCDQDGGGGLIEPVQSRGNASEPVLGACQGQAKEKVVVEQPGEGRFLLACCPLGEAPDPGLGGNAQQAVTFEETGQGLKVAAVGGQRGFRLDRLDHGRGRAQAPAGEHLEVQPADAIEAVAHRVVDHPRR
jgi:hypothetical protein